MTDSVGRNIYLEGRWAMRAGRRPTCSSERLEGRDRPHGLKSWSDGDLVDYAVAEGKVHDDSNDFEPRRRAATRLMQDSPAPELDALTSLSRRAPISRSSPKAVARRHRPQQSPKPGSRPAARVRHRGWGWPPQSAGIDVPRDKPLHSLFGEYLKRLREAAMATITRNSSVSG